MADVSTAITKAQVAAGDILNKAESHVVTVISRDGDTIDIIEASSADSVNKVRIWEDRDLQDYIDKGYSPRRLDLNP